MVKECILIFLLEECFLNICKIRILSMMAHTSHIHTHFQMDESLIVECILLKLYQRLENLFMMCGYQHKDPSILNQKIL